MAEKITTWYVMMGLITVIIGTYRHIKGKQTFEPDELTTLSWFLAWPVWLGWLVWRLFQTKILKNIGR